MKGELSMAWARIDDGFHAHPKTRETSYQALGLFAVGVSFAAHYMTDGHLPHSFVRDHVRGRAGRHALHELVERGWLIADPPGYRIHDFLDFNPSRAQVLAERDKARRKKAAQRTRQRQSSLPWSDPPPLSPGGQALVSPGTSPGGDFGVGGEEGHLRSRNGRESRGRAADDAARVAAILRRGERFTPDPLSLLRELEDALVAVPRKDPFVAAETAVEWVGDPEFRQTHPVRAFAAALRKQPVAVVASSQRANAYAYRGSSRCPDCRSEFDRNDPKREHANAGRCDDCQGRFEALALGEATR